MKRSTIFAAAGLVLVASTASAQTRPDLPNIGTTATPSEFNRQTTNANGTNVETANVQVVDDAPGDTQIEFALEKFVVAEAGDKVGLWVTVLGEPDKVKRNVADQTLEQRDFASFIFLLVADVGAFTSTAFTSFQSGCGGSVVAKNPVGGFYAVADSTQTCSEAALNSLLVNPAARTLAKTLFGAGVGDQGILATANNLAN